jgi:hypothetical protein
MIAVPSAPVTSGQVIVVTSTAMPVANLGHLSKACVMTMHGSGASFPRWITVKILHTIKAVVVDAYLRGTMNKIKMCVCGHAKHDHNEPMCSGTDTMVDIIMGWPMTFIQHCTCTKFERDRSKTFEDRIPDNRGQDNV